MKITGPGPGTPPEASPPVEEAKGPSGKGFAEKVERAAGAEPGRAAEGPSGPGGVADIGADLQAGRLTPEAALERVIERVVERQVGANAPAAIREQVGAALRQALEDDPLLAEKVRALGRSP